ncbi:hypothetical protein [Micromonospora sp. NPDC049301]|uniref:ATP-grasp domain-containing protein n=1 Tax=Micromonospora sp. NPDC049301 TaxID=3155723 RepID=UPI00341855E7
MQRLVLITDYLGAFYSTCRSAYPLPTMDVGRLADNFRQAGYEPQVTTYADLDLSADLQGVPVLYTSSEDRGLEYRSWIEDLVLALETSGARTVPSYRFLRAHHNKVMMEALRTQLFPKEAALLRTRSFGTFEELAAVTEWAGSWPKVIKPSEGAGATNVALVDGRNALLKAARRIGRTRDLGGTAREHAKRILRRDRHQPRSLHRQKFIVQEFVPGLSGDFKVLRFGDRFYTLWRRNRPGDFRASGSGIWDFDDTGGADRSALLDYAARISDTLGTPTASLDIGFDGSDFHLIEFQCIHFGTVTAEKSSQYYVKTRGEWHSVPERCDIEAVFCQAIVQHLDR